ncbi:sensor histidine kinase KdpD [Kosakonia sp. S42]|uniref:sensor histidine kinase n=1 Tax=Kosakonia sp. S42 TaxID=2767458 RepID=UPI0019096C66|nr:sensor histidine kinase KdpD [Kosakonia sp. S42]MBK0019291.1 sensor histidine kinase KdpD [Kosakonia sp. S42]
MKVDRPDPDELLRVVNNDGNPLHRGRLKVFFGMCAGVGKTYAMLQAARQRQAEGVAVGIGVVETHGRVDTLALIQGIPQLPLRRTKLSGREEEEFDLDGALTSGLQLIVVDELAHSNIADSRHTKRWQDVEELLDAGLDVYTALNVQHLESLNDIVSGIIGVRVRETVPDRVFDSASDVVLVDLPVDDLLARLNSGKVYLPISIEQAQRNFFRRGNLIALREIALRRVADRINADVHVYRVSNAIRNIWATRELLMICVSADCSQEVLIREGARLAQYLQAKCVVVHVDQPLATTEFGSKDALSYLARCTQYAGGEFASISGQDIAQTILNYAKQRNVTKLIMGNAAARVFIPFKTQLVDRIARQNPEMGLILLRLGDTPRRVKRRRIEISRGCVASLLIAVIACLVTTAVAGWLLRFFDLSNVIMLFLITVVFIALRLGRVAGAWASIVSVASFDYFFVEPRFSFSVTDTQYIFTFGLMLVVAIIIGQLAARLSAEARAARDGERRASALARVTRDLSGTIVVEQIIAVCQETIGPLIETQIALILPNDVGRLVEEHQANFVDLPTAQWTFDHIEESGHGTQTLNGAKALYLPLKAPMAIRGVLAVLPPMSGTVADRRLIDAICSAIAQALERIYFVDVARDTIVRMEGERMRNTLLSAVSHDLKTPLTAIRGLAEILEHPQDIAESECIDIARSIRAESDELRRLVSNLLDLARIQSEGVKLQKEWHSLSEIVGIAIARSANILQPRRVLTDLPPELPLVEIDALLLERVLNNLFDNVAKYTPSTSTITVRGRNAGDSMYLFVEDDGPGLPTNNTDVLFEPFARGQKESSIAGVGLGLALCRKIITAHGGTLSAKSRKPHGAIFKICLPLRTSPSIDFEVRENEQTENPDR